MHRIHGEMNDAQYNTQTVMLLQCIGQAMVIGRLAVRAVLPYGQPVLEKPANGVLTGCRLIICHPFVKKGTLRHLTDRSYSTLVQKDDASRASWGYYIFFHIFSHHIIILVKRLSVPCGCGRLYFQRRAVRPSMSRTMPAAA